MEDQVSSPLTSEPYDTVGILMNPTMDLTTQTTDLESRVFSILDTHNFKDLRGGQEGTGDERSLGDIKFGCGQCNFTGNRNITRTSI